MRFAIARFALLTIISNRVVHSSSFLQPPQNITSKCDTEASQSGVRVDTRMRLQLDEIVWAVPRWREAEAFSPD